jgi:1-deoxy-D-xylulose-5-phosphate synthase
VPILPNLEGPADLRGLSEVQLAQLALEIRETIISTVAETGGHLGSSLGVVELTIALHRLLESPRDHIVWDTGHQAYPHKLLTGRLERFGTLRQLEGVGGFPRRSESAHDVFDGGHAGTGLSIAEGLAEARDVRHGFERVAVVVGDAALMSGLSLEALNDIGQRKTQMLIVVNDNAMSISPTVGAFSRYLSQIKLSSAWRQSKSAYDRTVERIPVVGPTVLELSKRLRSSVVKFAQPGQLFEDLGITYIGVVPGHDLHALIETLGAALALPGPTIVHVRTQKGRGYRPAEADQVGFHGAALPPMAPPVNGVNGNGMPSESMADDAAPPTHAPASAKKNPNYTAVFAAELIELARVDRRIVGITAGMPTGTGLSKFQAEFPERFFDVGIAEQHAVTFATGLAMGGLRPVVAVYSTFLQRAFDQTVHDVCQNDQPVLIAVDRAGLVGEDLGLAVGHGALYRVDHGTGIGAYKLVALLLCFPCFRVSEFLFRCAYLLQQRKLVRLGRDCTRLGGQNHALKLDNLPLDISHRFKLKEALSDVASSLDIAATRAGLDAIRALHFHFRYLLFPAVHAHAAAAEEAEADAGDHPA